MKELEEVKERIGIFVRLRDKIFSSMRFNLAFGVKFVDKKARVFEIAVIHLGDVENNENISFKIDYVGDFTIRFTDMDAPITKVGLREVGTEKINLVTPDSLYEFIEKRILKKL